MIRSMTGFGRAVGQEGNTKFTVEIRGVNHRYLEINIRSPRDMNFLDNNITEYIKEKVVRGKIEISIKVETAPQGTEEIDSSQYQIKINHDLINNYIAALTNISDKYEIKKEVDLKDIAQLDNAIIVDKKEQNVEQMFNMLLKAIEPAMDKFINTRETEGAQMKKDILLKLEDMLFELNKIKDIAPKLPKEYKVGLEERIKKLVNNNGNGIDEARLAQEVAYFADKHAIDEEIVRLESHFENFTKELNSGGRVGRKLDFMCQEINREANTIGSKANNLEITNCVIEIKSLLEKIREQVQNIE